MDRQTSRALGIPIGLVILLAIIAINYELFNWLIAYLADNRIIEKSNLNYFRWYVKTGIGINAAVGVVALLWEGLESREDLLSSHPAQYLRGAFQLMAIFKHSLSVQFENLKYVTKEEEMTPLGGIVTLAENSLCLVLLFVVGLLGLAWLWVIAPLNYFIILVSGALGRQQLRKPYYKPILIEEAKETILTKQETQQKLPSNAIDISIARKPFAVTHALTSLVLLIIGQVLPKIGLAIV